MLEPQSRATLTEQLAPPSGFDLSYAVGTTFTLDLTTALSVPLSFASRHAVTSDDALGVLDALRRTAGRIDIFPQAGEIAMGTPSDLVGLLEEMIHPVRAPRGLFHPKVWFLEYRSGDRYAYRLLCASRNLTDDRSWDAIVRLDGHPSPKPVASNRSLADLLRTLPSMAIHPLPRERRAAIEELASRFETVTWERPSDVHSIDFDVFGLAKNTIPELSGVRALIVSPFVSDEGLQILSSGVRTTTHLLSRDTSIDRLSPTRLASGLKTYVLDDAAIAEDDALNAGGLSGLHAKVVVLDRTNDTQVLIGSANATDAAWTKNVEVMVRFIGRKSALGVTATLDALGDLKMAYASDGGDSESEQEEAERHLEALIRRLAATQLTARVVPGDSWSMRLWSPSSSLLEQVHKARATLSWHLLTRTDLGGASIAAEEAGASDIGPLPLTDITPFIVLVVRDDRGNERRTIVVAELLDDHPSRRDAIIARQLTDRAAFLRLLALLLDLTSSPLPGTGGGFGQNFGDAGPDGSGLFEALVRSVGVGHQGLADARRIIEFIRDHDDAKKLLPPGFEKLWANVWSAHRALSEGSR